MSDSTGPVRRRRIAGENKPAPPAKKAPIKKASAKKGVAKKATAKKTAPKKPAAKVAPATNAPEKDKAPGAKVAAASSAVSQDSATRTVATAKVARPTRPPARPPVVTPARGSATDATGTSRRDLRWLVPAVLVTVAAIVLGVFLTVKGVTHIRGGGQDLSTSNDQASAAAGTAAETIFSFRYDQLDQHLSASKALMTPAFSKDFDKIAPALTELAPQRKIVVKAVTRNAAVLACGDECSATKANVLVFVDQARLVGGSKEPTVFANRISVSMVKTDGGWLVNNIRAL